MINETLKKIDYENLDKFLVDINYNFAVLENSPLYKGIIGKDGLSVIGDSGKRGSSFLFVDFTKFQEQFPSQLTKSSDINMDFINYKLLDFTEKNKLMLAFGVTEFVNKDIVILTNSLMHVFDFDANRINSTGISFNESTNISTKIDQIVADAVNYAIINNPIFGSISSIFTTYTTLAKNYADTNNTHTTTSVLPTSVYSPYIQGYTSDGIVIDNHKYFGFTDEKYSVNDNGTFVFGSMKKYYQILQATINTDTAQTLNSNYATGVGNIPSMVVMQDTYNAGILIGYKNSLNLKRFGSIFKNELNELIIESDSGINPSEFSRILLHKDYLKFDKLVQFGNDLEVTRDSKFFGDINNKGIRTGKFTTGLNQLVTEIGQPISGGETKTKLLSKTVDFSNYKTNVLLTDNNGVVLKTHSLENAIPNENIPMVGYNLLETNIINSPTKFLTSNYYNYLARKINIISSFTNSNYWKKSEFHTGVIPSLHLYNNLTVGTDAQIGGVLSVGNVERKLQVFGNLAEFNSTDVSLTKYLSKVLVTDTNGKIVKTYSVENQSLNLSDLIVGNPLSSIGSSEFSFITTKYYDHLLKKINTNNANMSGDFWTKGQFASSNGVAGDIKVGVNNQLVSFGGVNFSISGVTLFKTSLVAGNKTINFGDVSSHSFFGGSLTFNNHKDVVFVTDTSGKLQTTKKIETIKFDEVVSIIGNNNIPNTVGLSQDTFAMGYHINWIARKINNINSFMGGNYWSKPQFETGVIPNLIISNNITAKSLKIGENPNDPNFYTDGGSNTSVGKVGGSTILKGAINFAQKPSVVVVTDINGTVVNNKLEDSTPKSSTHSIQSSGLTASEAEIETAYYEKDIVEPLKGTGSTRIQEFLNYPTLATKHITSNYYNLLINHIKNLRKLIYNRPTFAYCDENFGGIGNGVPNGGIIYWNLAFGEIPVGWVICDGRIIPGLNVATPQMIDKFVEGSYTPNVISGATNHKIGLETTNLPSHTHTTPAHTHTGHVVNAGLTFASGGNAGSTNVSKSGETLSGGGGNTSATGNGTEFSIKPKSISLIPIMKFWDGRGIMPIVNMPSFGTITNISQTNNTNSNTLNFDITIQDTSVTNFQIEMKRQDGLNPNQWVVLNLKPWLIGVINRAVNLMDTGTFTAEFRLKAMNGSSFGTNGEYSTIKNENIAWTFPLTPTAPSKPVATAMVSGSYATSSETVTLGFEFDEFSTPIQYYEVQVSQTINNGLQTPWELAKKEYTNMILASIPFSVSSSPNPQIFTRKFYRIRIVDTYNVVGEFSDVVSVELNRNYNYINNA